MIQLTINTESDDVKGIIETLDEIIKQIKSGSSGDYDQSVSWWLEDTENG